MIFWGLSNRKDARKNESVNFCSVKRFERKLLKKDKDEETLSDSFELSNLHRNFEFSPNLFSSLGSARVGASHI